MLGSIGARADFCGQSMDAMIAYLDAMERGALTRAKGIGLTPAPAASGPVQSCAGSFKKMISLCPGIDSPTNPSPECTDAAKLAASDETALPALDLAKLYTHAANCRRSIAACLRYGSRHSSVPDDHSTRGACVGQYQGRIAETKGATDPLVLNERAHIEQAATYFRQVKAYLSTLADCETAIGDAHEQKAREQLAKFERERTVRTGDTAKPAIIDCLERQVSYRFCLFSDDGPRIEQASDNTPSATADFLRRFGIPLAKHEDGCTAFALRSPGSTGAKIVGTAGHCVKNSHTKFFVFDINGRGTWVPAVCQLTPDPNQQDYALCTLEREVPTYPIYLATLDPARTDDRCTTTGWLMACGPGFFRGLANSRSEISGLGFPAGQPLTYTRGRTYFDEATAMVYHDMVSPRGTSGSPLLVTTDTDGTPRKVVLAIQAWSAERLAQGYGNAIPAAFAKPFAPSPTTASTSADAVPPPKIAPPTPTPPPAIADSPDEIELLRVINQSLQCLPQPFNIPPYNPPLNKGFGYKDVRRVADRQFVRDGQLFFLLFTNIRIIWTYNDKERIESRTTHTLSFADLSHIDIHIPGGQSKGRHVIKLQCRNDKECIAYKGVTLCHVTLGGGSDVSKSCSDKPVRGGEERLGSSANLHIEACSAKVAADINDALNALGKKRQQ